MPSAIRHLLQLAGEEEAEEEKRRGEEKSSDRIYQPRLTWQVRKHICHMPMPALRDPKRNGFFLMEN